MARLRSKSFTLLELIIAMVLLIIIMLGFVSVDLFSRHHLFTADKRTKLQNELSLVLEHMSKNIIRSTGDAGNAGLWTGTTSSGEDVVDIRVDDSVPPTPGNYSDDIWVGYGLDGRAGHGGELFFCNNTINHTNYGTREALARHIPGTGFNFNLVADPVTGTPVGVNVSITARENIANPASLDNPEVNMRATVYSRSTSAR